MNRKHSLAAVRAGQLTAALALSVGIAACGGDSDNDPVATPAEPTFPAGVLNRVATLPLGSEATGLFVKEDGELFLNIQHPSGSNSELDAQGNVYAYGTVGVIQGFDINGMFESLAAPTTDAEKEIIRVAAGTYNVLGQEMDTWAGAPKFGLGQIGSEDNSVLITDSDDPDFNGWIEVSDTEGYLFTNWEARPGGMSRMHLVRDGDGKWVVGGNDVSMVDFSAVGGTWVNCFGTVSPWNTPLTSEELYFDNTNNWNDGSQGSVQDLADYLANEVGTDYDVTFPNPYRYGYIVEITDPTGTPTPVKHFTIGRYSHENAVVMPDEKTVYASDDGGGVVFFKFVADTAGDLSSGTLYAAKVTQDAGDNNPSVAGFDIEWVELASSSNATIETWVDDYDGITEADAQPSYITDEQVCDWAESKVGSDLDCDADTSIDSNPFADDRPAFLESRKAAVALGATGEFNKMEGVNVNMKRAEEAVDGTDLIEGEDVTTAYVYMAMSDVDGDMTDTSGAIQLSEAGGSADCGVVYKMPLEANYNITRMEPAIMGGPFNGADPDNQCSIDNISNPDNVLVLDDGRVIIGEDTGLHENNMVWVFNPDA